MDNKTKYETEIDFLALPKSPSRLFGWIFPYYAILFVIVGIFFVKTMDNSSFNNVVAVYTDSLEITADVEVKKGGIMPAIDLDIISNPTNEIIERGKELYKTNCSSCHGDEGKGDGVAAAALNPAPRSFLNLDGWKNGVSFSSIYKTLQEGIAGGAMIAYEFIPLEDRVAIIHYIQTLADYPKIDDNEVSALDKKYELSKGIIAPNNISIEMAKDKISVESSEFDKNIDAILERINSSDDQSSARLFFNSALDKEKVIRVFKRDFAKNNISDFINRVVAFPVESGFRPSVSLLSQEELGKIHKIISNSLG